MTTLDAAENLLAEYRSLKTVPRNLRTIKALETLVSLLADMDDDDAPPPVEHQKPRPLGCHNRDRSQIVGWKDNGRCQHDSLPDPDCEGCIHQKHRAHAAPLDGTGGVR